MSQPRKQNHENTNLNNPQHVRSGLPRPRRDAGASLRHRLASCRPHLVARPHGLTFANIGETRGIIINWRFIDADGEIVATSERTITIPFGKMVSVDLDRNTLPRPEARVQIRAEVEVLTHGNPRNDLSTSLEVFDNDTGKTTVFFWPTETI